jgi:hypothetical protein
MMNEREALCEAIKAMRFNGWSAALPKIPAWNVNEETRTFHEICRLVIALGPSGQVPDDVAGDLFFLMRGDRKLTELTEKFGPDRSYVNAAECFLAILEAEIAYQRQRDQQRLRDQR